MTKGRGKVLDIVGMAKSELSSDFCFISQKLNDFRKVICKT